MRDMEQVIREVNGTMAMEVMPLTDADKKTRGQSCAVMLHSGNDAKNPQLDLDEEERHDLHN